MESTNGGPTGHSPLTVLTPSRVHGYLLMNTYAQLTFMRQDMSIALMVVTEFVFALVFLIVYDCLYATATASAGRGAVFGTIGRIRAVLESAALGSPGPFGVSIGAW